MENRLNLETNYPGCDNSSRIHFTVATASLCSVHLLFVPSACGWVGVYQWEISLTCCEKKMKRKVIYKTIKEG